MLLSSLLSGLVLNPFAFNNNGFSNPISILSIQHTVAQYPLLVDSKNFNGLSAVLTDDIYADYPPPFGVLVGLPAVKQSLSSNLVNLTSQHSLTTQSIDVMSHGHADATTYFIATLFGINKTITAGKITTAYGRYEDKLRIKNGVWKIYRRHLISMGPMIVRNVTGPG